MQEQVIVAPPNPTPAPAQAPAPPGSPEAAVVVTPSQIATSPRAAYVAAREKREVIGEQMTRVLNRRERVISQLEQADAGSAVRGTLEQHLAELNGRIIDLEKQLHASDAEVSAAAGVPGSSTPERPPNPAGADEDAWSFAVVFVAIGLMIVCLSWARRLWKGAGKAVAQVPAALEARFTRFEQAIDAMAIEIERVTEGQRFLTRVLSDQGPRVVGAGPLQPIQQDAAVPEAVRRS